MAVEDVVILVERGAVADLGQRIDLHRSHPQRAHVVEVLRCQLCARPQRRGPRHVIELAAVVETGRRLVVVATNHRLGFQRAHAIHHGIGFGAIANQIAEHEHAIPMARGVIHHRVERVHVGVDVGENQIPHES
jgi:hypothetical protein